MTMASATPLQALQEILTSMPDGEAVDKLQLLLYTRFSLKMSCRMIEAVFMGNPDLFSQQEGRWIIRKMS
jgi:hypothetical protein